MMGRWTKRDTVMCVAAVIISWSIIYIVGFRSGQTSQKLSANKTRIASADSVTKLVTAVTDSATRHTAVLDSTHDVVRAKVRVVRDSVFVRDTVYVNSDIADLIVADDSLIAAQKRSLALRDTLIASLRVGISLRDTRIHLLESEVAPGKLKRFLNATRWVAVGAVVGVAVAHR